MEIPMQTKVRNVRRARLHCIASLAILASVLFVRSISPGQAETGGFHNPILSGFYPDPSICRVGPDYYLVTSTFSYFPGIPVLHSRDLVNWKLIGHVLDRPQQLNLDKQGVSRGLFAPAIRHNKGVFYVTCTLVDIGGNFVATSRTPEGPWSSPGWLPEVDGIDPSLFFDDDGSAYVLYNSIAPDGRPLYEGHRTIRMRAFDAENLKVAGEEMILVNGGTDISKKPVWIEAPHIFRKDGWYYLIAAEGGTADQHSEVVFRSRKVDGPYVPYEQNPILTQRHLDPRRPFPVTSTGHADFVQTDTGDWWAVFLGCRPYPPYEEHCYNTGRETFLAPVKWESGWPVINPGFAEVQYAYPCPIKPCWEASDIPHSGNFTIRDEFDTDTLNPHWVFLRTPLTKWYSLEPSKGMVSLKLRPETCSGNGNPSFLGRRQQHLRGSASVAMRFRAATEGEKSGIVVFQNETHYYYLCRSQEGNTPVVQLFASRAGDSTGRAMEKLASRNIPLEYDDTPLYLRIDARGNEYAFQFAHVPGEWNVLKEGVDAKFLSTRVAGGFVGCMFAMYATSLGKPSRSVAWFDWFEYSGDDEVYRDGRH